MSLNPKDLYAIANSIIPYVEAIGAVVYLCCSIAYVKRPALLYTGHLMEWLLLTALPWCGWLVIRPHLPVITDGQAQWIGVIAASVLFAGVLIAVNDLVGNRKSYVRDGGIYLWIVVIWIVFLTAVLVLTAPFALRVLFPPRQPAPVQPADPFVADL